MNKKSPPTIRSARFVDTPGILRLFEQALSTSRYAAFTGMDQAHTKRVISESIQRQNAEPVPNAMIVLVADNGDSLEGIIIGAAMPLYHVLDATLVTDLIWYAPPEANSRTGLKLVRGLHKWAAKGKGAVVVRHGMTDAIGDPDRTSAVFRAAGFRRAGVIYEKEIDQ